MLDLLAQVSSTAAQTQPAVQAPPFVQQLIQWLPIIVALGALYFLMNGTKRKEEKARKLMIDNIKRGDRIQTIGGVLGTVVTADADEIVVKVDETTNTKVRFIRSAVNKVLVDDKKVDAK